MKLKEFKEPTDIVIIGSVLYDEDQEFDPYISDVSITDDESSFVIVSDNEILHRLTSDGFINVITKEVFDQNKDYFAEESIDGDIIYLPNFQGIIGVKVVFEKHFRPKNNNLNDDQNIHIEELDLDEYLMYQDGFGDYEEEYEDVEYCITIPTDTEVCKGQYNDGIDTWEIEGL